MLFKTLTTSEVALELLEYPNALQYQTARFKNQFGPDGTELDRIALYLCGTSNKSTALAFMRGLNNEKAFYSNVNNNAEECVPVILRAINLRLSAIQNLQAARQSTNKHTVEYIKKEMLKLKGELNLGYIEAYQYRALRERLDNMLFALTGERE